MSIVCLDNITIKNIDSFVIKSVEEVSKTIILAKKCYFYDACTIINHSRLQCNQRIYEFIKLHEGCVILTDSIFNEVMNDDGSFDKDIIEFIKGMYEDGIQVLVLNEKNLFDVLSLCYSSNAIINEYLAKAVIALKSRRESVVVRDVLNGDKGLSNLILKTPYSSNENNYTRFFERIKESEETKNLGEELIILCMHILSNLPESNQGKYVFVTDDKGAINLMNCALKTEQRLYQIASTPKLAQLMFETNIVTNKQELMQMLDTKNDRITFSGNELYENQFSLKTMSKRDLADAILSRNIRIGY